MSLGIDVSLNGLIICGFGISFAIWGISRGVNMIVEIIGSRSGRPRSM